MTHVAKWACDTCGREFSTEQEAARCEARPMPPNEIKAGDVVTLGARFGWYDGDRSWIVNADRAEKTRDDRRPALYEFFYTVTLVEPVAGEHRWCFHLETRAMTNKTGYSAGYTYDKGHHTPALVANPPDAIKAAGAKMLGRRADHLV